MKHPDKEKKKEVMWACTMAYNLCDRYRSEMPIKRLVALRAFFKGRLGIEWDIPVTMKDKRLKLEGMKKV